MLVPTVNAKAGVGIEVVALANEFGSAGTWLLAYVLGPLAGALAAAFAYDAIVIQDRPSMRPVDKLGGP